MQDAALFFDPNNAKDLSDKILQIKNNKKIKNNLIQKGQDLIINLTPKHYVEEMIAIIDGFMPIRECWDSCEIWKHK